MPSPQFGTMSSQRRQVRQQYGLEDEPTVVFAGKLRESKGVHILLRAMTRVWELTPRAALVLVGGTEYGRGRTMRETPFMDQLRRDLAQAPGRVILTGFIPPTDMPRAYLLGDVFVGPSQIEEGLGLVFLEAAAAGLPIIATRKGGIPEVVRDDFNGLLLRQPDDAAELAEKITGLLNDAPLRQRLGQQGRDWVRADFSWEKIARTLEEFYDEVDGAVDQGPGVRDIFVSGSQAPAWEPHCRQSSCFARESSMYYTRWPQAGAWERGKGWMRCAFPPLRATGVPARRSTGLMVRGAPYINSGGTGFQPVRRTGKMPVPPKIFRAFFPGHWPLTTGH